MNTYHYTLDGHGNLTADGWLPTGAAPFGANAQHITPRLVHATGIRSLGQSDHDTGLGPRTLQIPQRRDDAQAVAWAAGLILDPAGAGRGHA